MSKEDKLVTKKFYLVSAHGDYKSPKALILLH